jgi:hypothetical protein
MSHPEPEIEEIFEAVDKIFPQLIQLLRQKHPELVKLYQQRYEYTKPQYSLETRLHNAYQILRTYQNLRR